MFSYVSLEQRVPKDQPLRTLNRPGFCGGSNS